MKAYYFRHLLNFKVPSGTSRGVLSNKESWFIVITDKNRYGVGECSLIAGLSPDPISSYEDKLKEICNNICLGIDVLRTSLEAYPSIIFGLETAYLSFESSDPFVLMASSFTKGEKSIPINGLIWMGEQSFMKKQIKEKIESGFNCIKIKVGALNFDLECKLLKSLRLEYSSQDIEIRLDANGSFSPNSALEKLKILSDYDLHSIEQPIGTKMWDQMAFLCEKSPLAIALDEELVGLTSFEMQTKMLSLISPSYIILKPSLIGGLKACDSWIKIAESKKINWWSTSALESNVGLNAISQWVFNKGSEMKQGLGTGQLYFNNIDSPCYIDKGFLKYNPNKNWETAFFSNYIF